jgi:hypothetical protein
MSITEQRVKEIINEQLYSSSTISPFTNFTLQEKVAYALKLSLNRITTDAFSSDKEWFNEPQIYNPVLKSSILKNTPLPYTSTRNYYTVVNINGVKYISNVKLFVVVEQYFNNSIQQIITNGIPPEILDTSISYEYSRSPIQDDFNLSGLLNKFPRQAWASFVYWKKQITGFNAKQTQDDNPQNTSGSGTYPNINNLSSIITIKTNSTTADPFKVYSTRTANSIEELAPFVYNTLREYIPIQLISNTIVDEYIQNNGSLNQINGAPQELLDKIYFPVVVNLSVPTYSTWNGNSIETIAPITDNMAFYNPLLERSLSETFGYSSRFQGNGYGIVAPLDMPFTNINTTYGKVDLIKEGNMIFNGDTGFVQFFGLQKPLSGTDAISVIRPPIVSAVKYVGETLTEGVITQVSGLPDPSIYNEKDLRIDTATNTIYRLAINNSNEKEWVSIGGGGSGGALESRVLNGNELNFYNTFNGMGSTKIMNARGVGLNDLDISANKIVLTYNEVTYNFIHIIGHGVTSPVSYDVSLSITTNNVTSYNHLGTFTLTPIANSDQVLVYSSFSTNDLLHRFSCQGTYIDEVGNAGLIGGTFTSIDPKVGYASLMIPTGSSATITNVNWNQNWRISFWYKMVNQYNDGSGNYILYFKNPKNPVEDVGIDLIYRNESISLLGTTVDIGSFVNQWVHISLMKNNNEYSLFIDNTEKISVVQIIDWNDYSLEFANYEPVISESAVYLSDICIYTNSTNYSDIENKPAIGRIISSISEITIPEKSLVTLTMRKLTDTFLSQTIDIKLISKKSQNLNIPHKFRFEKAIQFLDYPDFKMNTGINMETYYTDEIGNQGEIDFPNNTQHYVDLDTTVKQLNITHYSPTNTTFDLSMIEIKNNERTTIYETGFTTNIIQYNRPIKEYTNPRNTIREYTCDTTYHNLYKWMDVSAIEEGAILMGGIFKQFSAPVHKSCLYVPKGTGVILTEFDWTDKTVSFWYRQEHMAEKRRNMILHFNKLEGDGNPYGIYLSYDASNSTLYIGGRKEDNSYVEEQQTTIELIDEWTHFTIQNSKVVINKTEINVNDIYWGNYVLEFCNWSPALLKTSAFLSDICIFNGNIEPDIEINNYENSLALNSIVLEQPVEINKGSFIELELRPRQVKRGYIEIECIPDIPANTTFSDSDGIIKYKHVQKTMKETTGNLTLYKQVESKYGNVQPYFLTYKLKNINAFSIIKNNNDNATYEITLKYGELIGDEIKVANEYRLTDTQNVTIEVANTVAKHSTIVDGSLCVWFPCDGYIDNYASEVGYENIQLLGGVYTTSDYKVGNSSIMIPRGSGLSMTSMDWNIPEWSISFWFKYVSTTFIHEIPLFWFGSKSHNKELEDGVHVIYDPSNTKVYLSTYKDVYGYIEENLNEWSLITVTKKDTSYCLYVNEEKIEEHIENVEWDTENSLHFAMFEGGNINTACYIDDIRVYNRCLEYEEIRHLNNVVIENNNAKCTIYNLNINVVIPDNNYVMVELKRSENNRSDVREVLYVNFYADDVTNDVLINLLNSGMFYARSGSEIAPTFSFLGDRDTGMYNSDVNELSFSSGGKKMLSVNMSDITLTGKMIIPDEIAVSRGWYTYINEDDYPTEEGYIFEYGINNIVAMKPFKSGNTISIKDVPEIVKIQNNGLSAVDYGRLVPILIHAIQQLKDEINIIKQQIEPAGDDQSGE